MRLDGYPPVWEANTESGFGCLLFWAKLFVEVPHFNLLTAYLIQNSKTW